MLWRLSNRFDPPAVAMADRHYNRQKPGTSQFVKPAQNKVFVALDRSALWVSVLQKREYCKHRWPGAWECEYFRNEGGYLSSVLIRQAVALTRWFWPTPEEGMITFVDPAKIRSTNPGYCFLQAGFVRLPEKTTKGYAVLWMDPAQMPEAQMPNELIEKDRLTWQFQDRRR